MASARPCAASARSPALVACCSTAVVRSSTLAMRKPIPSTRIFCSPILLSVSAADLPIMSRTQSLVAQPLSNRPAAVTATKVIRLRIRVASSTQLAACRPRICNVAARSGMVESSRRCGKVDACGCGERGRGRPASVAPLPPDEHERRLLPPGERAGAVVQESEDERDHAEERAVVTRHDSVVEEEAAGERPQDVGAEPLGDDRYQHGRARAGLAEEARNADGEGAAEEEQQERDDGEAGHAFFRYSGRQRSRR